MSLATWLFLAIASGFAGFVDAMAGGGGLVQLPALLIGISDKPLPMILGTNKIPAVFGTTTATYNYFKRVKPDLRIASYMAIPAFIGSMKRARLAASVPKDLYRPLILALLIEIALNI